jgi:hypothetical protein
MNKTFMSFSGFPAPKGRQNKYNEFLKECPKVTNMSSITVHNIFRKLDWDDVQRYAKLDDQRFTGYSVALINSEYRLISSSFIS